MKTKTTGFRQMAYQDDKYMYNMMNKNEVIKSEKIQNQMVIYFRGVLNSFINIASFLPLSSFVILGVIYKGCNQEF